MTHGYYHSLIKRKQKGCRFYKWCLVNKPDKVKKCRAKYYVCSEYNKIEDSIKWRNIYQRS